MQDPLQMAPNDDGISHIHDKVACNDYIITHKQKIQLTKGFNDAQHIAQDISKQRFH